MGAAIGQILGNAVGVAISPVPIIALVLMLFSKAAARNSLAFTTGWLVGLFAAGAVVLALGIEGSDGGESDGGGWIKVAIGALLLVMAVRQWRSRPRDGQPAELPGWMSAIDDLSPVKAVGLGLVLTVANPKNLGLTVAAAVAIGAAGLDGGEEITTLVVFVLVASITIVVPVAVYLVAGERAAPALDALKDWLVDNNATVMTVLFVVLGAKVLGDGIAIVA